MYRPNRGRWHVPTSGWLVVLAICVGIFYGMDGAHRKSLHVTDAAEVAVERMRAGMLQLRAARERHGIGIDPSADPNRTGLIGVEWSAITTTYAEPVTKRTATHPLWAGAIVRWMEDAGVAPGDIILASFSGSFPGLNLAVWSAADTLGAELIAISSVGASMWGANIANWTWPDMERALFMSGAISGRSAAVALGGDSDRGPTLEPDGLSLALEAVERSGLLFLDPPTLEQAVQSRLDLFDEMLAGRQPALYVNVGGAQASLGLCLNAHRMPPGLSTTPIPCEGGVPGVITHLSLHGVPVLNLLNIKELALRLGIPIDGRFGLDTRPKSVYDGGPT